MTGEAMLRAVLADPKDHTARLAFADWCDEHGEGELAAALRSSAGPGHVLATIEQAELLGRKPCLRLLWAVAVFRSRGPSRIIVAQVRVEGATDSERRTFVWRRCEFAARRRLRDWKWPDGGGERTVCRGKVCRALELIHPSRAGDPARIDDVGPILAAIAAATPADVVGRVRVRAGSKVASYFAKFLEANGVAT